MVTEADFLRKSCELERSLTQEKYATFCEEKVAESTEASEKNMWNFLKVSSTDRWALNREKVWNVFFALIDYGI